MNLTGGRVTLFVLFIVMMVAAVFLLAMGAQTWFDMQNMQPQGPFIDGV